MLCKVIDIIYVSNKTNCTIEVYARSETNQVIHITVKNFKPHCYTDCVDDNLLKKLHIKYIKEEQRYFEGFCGNKKYLVTHMFFNTYESLRYNAKTLAAKNFRLYESDLAPELRFIHDSGIESSGIISINDITNTSHTVELYMSFQENMFKLEEQQHSNINLVIASFDIECDSWANDFPVAERTWNKFTDEIFGLMFSEITYNAFEEVMSIVLDPEYRNVLIPKGYHCNDSVENIENKLRTASENDSDIYSTINKYIVNELCSKMFELGHRSDPDFYFKLVSKIIHCKIIGNLDITPVHLRSIVCKDFVLDTAGKKIVKKLWDSFYDRDKKGFKDTINKLQLFGDHVIQIGTTVMQGEKILSKNILCLKPVSNFTNEELIKLENTMERNDITLVPEDTLMQFLNNHDCPETIKQGSLEERVRWKCKKEEELQLASDHANVNIHVFTKELDDNTLQVIDDIVNIRQQIFSNEDPDIIRKTITKDLSFSFYHWIPVDSYCLSLITKLHNKYGLNLTKDSPVSSVFETHDGNVFTHYGSEAELLKYWPKLIQSIDPDIITGYNIFGFDFEFMYKRACNLNILPDFLKLGRNGRHSSFVHKNLTTNAYGHNEMNYIEMHGRVLIDLFKFVRINYKFPNYKLDTVCANFLFKEKAGIAPYQIFNYQRYGEQRGKDCRKQVAMYCVIDCILCNRLMNSMQVLDRNCVLATVSKVPLSYLFLRGQSIKLLSLLFYYCDHCKDTKYLIEDKAIQPGYTQPESESYEGATVLDPVIKLHNIPVAVGDFNSLYPNSMIARNISHDTLVCPGSEYWNSETNQPDFERLKTDGFELVHSFNYYEQPGVIDPVPGILYNTGDESTRTYYVLYQGNEYRGILDLMLMELIQLRKDTRAKQKLTKDKFHWNILESQQLAAKVLCNSAYGILGATSSKIYNKNIAACVTAVGRSMINAAKGYVEKTFVDKCTEIEYLGEKHTVYTKETHCIYGDTDSIFIQFHNYYDKDYTKQILGLESVYTAHALCEYACDQISNVVINTKPERIEFEKVIWPFILFAKKRYFGRYYTKFNDHYYENSMGILIKRRDQAPITQKIYKTILMLLMESTVNNVCPQEQCRLALLKFKEMCVDMIKPSTPIEEFVISETLGANYKNAAGMAHVVLAMRQAERDPGNAFAVNDRVPYCFFYQTGTTDKTLQGNRVETPEFIKANHLSLDYEYYVNHAFVKPMTQLFEIISIEYPNALAEFNAEVDEIRRMCRNATQERYIENSKNCKILPQKMIDTMFANHRRKLANESKKEINIQDYNIVSEMQDSKPVETKHVDIEIEDQADDMPTSTHKIRFNRVSECIDTKMSKEDFNKICKPKKKTIQQIMKDSKKPTKRIYRKKHAFDKH